MKNNPIIRADYPNPDLIVYKKDECELYYQDGEEWKKFVLHIIWSGRWISLWAAALAYS
ncbi:MAG: hypothetical protein WCD89_04740 [Anaerocolumna sp.]